MASKSSASLALFLALNVLMFTLVASCDSTCPSSGPMPKQTLKPSLQSSSGKCPIDALKLGVCVDVLGPLLNIALGTPPKTPCCSLIANLVDLEAALCLCISIRASVLGINLNIPLSLSLLINYCGKKVPQGFQCP